MKKTIFVLCILLCLCMLCACGNNNTSNSPSTPAYPMGFDSGLCGGVADFPWGSEKSAVTENPAILLNALGNPVLENAEFAGVTGSLELRFGKTSGTLIAGIYTFESSEPAEDYQGLFNALSLAYGESTGPSSIVSSGGSAANWSGVPTGSDATADIILTLYADGSITLHILLNT